MPQWGCSTRYHRWPQTPEKLGFRQVRSKFPKTPVVSMGRRNTQLRPTFNENKS